MIWAIIVEYGLRLTIEIRGRESVLISYIGEHMFEQGLPGRIVNMHKNNGVRAVYVCATFHIAILCDM